jgi:lysophospholipase L1-like esterase
MRRWVVGLTALLAACLSAGNAGAASQAASIQVTSPAAPLLVTAPGGSIEAHSDYVKITYVTANGETLASEESLLSQPAGALTVVHSPVAATGVIGYNVYAVKNNGGSGKGHTRQNSAPIPIGTDYTEPATGWVQGGAVPPLTSSIVVGVAPQQTVYELTPAGGYFDASIFRGERAAVLMPHNDAISGSTLSLLATAGLPEQAPGPSRVKASGSEGPVVVETIRFAFSHDVTLDGYPTFKFPQSNPGAIQPCQLNLYDGSTRALLATVPGFAYGSLAFLSNYGTPFRAVGGRPYYAELVSRSPDSVRVGPTTIPRSFRLPVVGGIGGTAILPSGKYGTGSSANLIASLIPAIGLPPLRGSGVRRALYYVSIVVSGTASFTEQATLRVTLPPSLAAKRRTYALAAFDAGFSRNGWVTGIRPSRVDADSLTFTAKLPGFVAWRQYGVALYEATSARPELSSTVPGGGSNVEPLARPTVAIVGDSISLLTIIPPSGAACSPGWGPLPECQYSNDPALNWPGVLAQMTGYNVVNLSALGVSTVKNEFTGPSMLSLMIPQIPTNAQFVVCQCGINDLSLSGQSIATTVNAGILTRAIHARAPRAHIVYIGLRCWTDCSPPAIAAWNATLKQLAQTYGAFVDIIPLGPSGASAVFPDGSHPNPTTARAIASMVAAALQQWGAAKP